MATLARLMIELGLDESYSAGLASAGAKLKAVGRRLNYPNPKTQAEMWRRSYMAGYFDHSLSARRKT